MYNARKLAMARMRAEADQLAAGTAIRPLAEEHKLPDTSPRPTFTLGLDQ